MRFMLYEFLKDNYKEAGYYERGIFKTIVIITSASEYSGQQEYSARFPRPNS